MLADQSLISSVSGTLCFVCVCPCLFTTTFFAFICNAWKLMKVSSVRRKIHMYTAYLAWCEKPFENSVCSNVCNNRETRGCGSPPLRSPLNKGQMGKTPCSPCSCFYRTSNYAYGPHQNRARHGMSLELRGSKLARCNKAFFPSWSSPII